MKNNRFRSTLALLALCPVINLHATNPAAAAPRIFGEIPLAFVAAKIAANGDTVTAGTSRIMVSMRLGDPSTVLADGSWLYSGYTAQLSESGPVQNGTLVIRFVKNAVSSLSLADKATVTALRQAPRPKADNQLLAVR